MARLASRDTSTRSKTVKPSFNIHRFACTIAMAEIKTCCIKPEPSVSSENNTEQKKTLQTQSLSRLSFWLAGQEHLLITQEGVRLPDNPVFSQSEYTQTDPLHFAGSGGTESKMSGPAEPLARHLEHATNLQSCAPKKVRTTSVSVARSLKAVVAGRSLSRKSVIFKQTVIAQKPGARSKRPL